MTLETHFTETFVARLAAREKQMQQHYRPVISVHKWFARRPGALFRALAERARLEALVNGEDSTLDSMSQQERPQQGVAVAGSS